MGASCKCAEPIYKIGTSPLQSLTFAL